MEPLILLSDYFAYFCDMLIERTNKEIIIRISSSIATENIQELVDYLRYTEIAGKSKARKTDLNRLLESVKISRRVKTTH